jgi:hypothetical protein
MTTRIYTGRSMWPTFRPGDVLHLEAAHGRIRAGDVVAFTMDGLPEPISVLVHRVTAVTTIGLATRGDNNRHPDPGHTDPQAVLGIVTHYRRGDRPHRVIGGRRGLLQARLRSLLQTLTPPLRRPLRVAYRALRASGVLARFWRPKVQRVQIESPHGPIVKFTWHNRTVARWWPTHGRFVCQKPFDLFLAQPGTPEHR